MGIDDEFIIKADMVSVRKADNLLLKDISFSLKKGEHLAITGASGSGKTTLGLALAGKFFYKGKIQWSSNCGTVVWVEQQHHFRNRSNTTELYYQQRFNSYDSEETQTVRESLGDSDEKITAVLQQMNIENLKDKPLIQLSNGENKKLQVAEALLLKPSVLIMDQPFTGLDTGTRMYLHKLINELAVGGVTILLITTTEEIPSCITKILLLEKGRLLSFESMDVYLNKYSKNVIPLKRSGVNIEKLEKIASQPGFDFQYAIRMKNINVQYGDKIILQDINWEVKKGERWLLSGPNGAGKSTLLSLVTADNPKAYANEIYLFDKKRGSGESIWDIKKKIGYLSPELHLFFDQGSTCFEAIASGLFDTIGLFRQLSDEDIMKVNDWMEIAGIKTLRQKRLFELSSGEQRIVLLARALVKNPPLLILDEPCQGIDHDKQIELLDLINTVCIQGNKTMVFVTHYANERPSCIDRFINLQDGKVV